jgi:hypothetical protein
VLLPACQSAYRRYYSTDTAVERRSTTTLRVPLTPESRRSFFWILAPLSTQFISKSSSTFSGSVLVSSRRWSGNAPTCLIVLRLSSSALSHMHGPWSIHCGVPQGLVVGPSGIVAYMEEIAETISEFSILSHQYADDTALLSHIPLADILLRSHRVSTERCLRHGPQLVQLVPVSSNPAKLRQLRRNSFGSAPGAALERSTPPTPY